VKQRTLLKEQQEQWRGQMEEELKTRELNLKLSHEKNVLKSDSQVRLDRDREFLEREEEVI
jgi:hypothetical protein